MEHHQTGKGFINSTMPQQVKMVSSIHISINIKGFGEIISRITTILKNQFDYFMKKDILSATYSPNSR